MYWRVEGSLLDLTTVKPVAFFTWNAQTFLERWVRRGLVLLMAALRPILYGLHRVLATRVVHTVLRGVSRDRLDLLGEEYFQYKLKPYLKQEGVRQLRELVNTGASVVLVSQVLDHVMRPLAKYLGVTSMFPAYRTATGPGSVDRRRRQVVAHTFSWLRLRFVFLGTLVKRSGQ